MAVGTYPIAVNPVTGALTYPSGTTGAITADSLTTTGEVAGKDYSATGLTGAATAVRFVGGTASVAPSTGTFSVGDFVITQNGQTLVCTVAGTPGTWISPRDTSNLVTSGEEVLDRITGSGGVTLNASGTIHLSYFTARKTETVNNLRTLSSGTASASLTLAKMGVYSVASNGDLTRVAVTASDTTLWNSTFTAYSKATTAGWSKQAGVRYAFAVIAVGSTMPQLAGAGINFADAATAPQWCGIFTGQTDLPSSIVAASVAADYRIVQGFVLP